MRDTIAALPVDNAVLDGEAVLMRADNTSDFEALRSRQGQAEAILVAYDVMEVDGQDVRPEPLEARTTLVGAVAVGALGAGHTSNKPETKPGVTKPGVTGYSPYLVETLVKQHL